MTPVELLKEQLKRVSDKLVGLSVDIKDLEETLKHRKNTEINLMADLKALQNAIKVLESKNKKEGK